MSPFNQPKPAAAKPLAALSSTLLARKGQAKPAMRPHGVPGLAPAPNGNDDLGWNDMGAEPVAARVPPVLRQREVLREELAASDPSRRLKPVSVATAARFGRETARKHGSAKAKAAFTLRLDHDRHLRLRIASALTNASAQVLITAALDQFLQDLPEVDALIAQLPAPAKR